MLVRSSISLGLLVSRTGAVDLRFRHAKLQGPPAVLPMVTGAPLPATVELRLAKRQSTDDFRVPDCATSCLSSAVVSHTNCQLFEHSCTCDVENALYIYAAAEPCLYMACGYTNNVMYMLSQDCITYMRTASTATTTAATKKLTSTDSPSTFTATKTESNGSVATITAVINPTSSSTTSAASPSSDTQQTELSKGAVAGIAVGATLGGLFIIAIVAYLIYRCRSSRKADRPGGAAAVAIASHQNPPPTRSDDRAELQGQGKQVTPSIVSATPVSALDASAGGVSPNTASASLMPSTVTTTPSPPPLGHQLGLVQHSSISWQPPYTQQPQMFQAVPSAQGGFVMVPVQPFPGQTTELGARGGDMGAVEVAGDSNVHRQHELPTQVYSTGPYEMLAPKGS